MSPDETARSWLREAEEELEAARVLHESGKYKQALFFCHLAVEKALKGAYVLEKEDTPPLTHNLVYLAAALSREWTDEQKTDLADLTQFVVDARYADPPWADEQATEENSTRWLRKTEAFLTLFRL